MTTIEQLADIRARLGRREITLAQATAETDTVIAAMQAERAKMAPLPAAPPSTLAMTPTASPADPWLWVFEAVRDLAQGLIDARSLALAKAGKPEGV